MIKPMTIDEDILRTFAIMRQLRPDLKEAEYLARVKDQQKNDGWHLVALIEEEVVRCVASYKFSRSFHFDKYMYVDDLVTDESQRSRGYGVRMLEWLEEKCRENGCSYMRLDTGVQRHGAHRFYLRNNFDLLSFHFVKKIEQT